MDGKQNVGAARKSMSNLKSMGGKSFKAAKGASGKTLSAAKGVSGKTLTATAGMGRKTFSAAKGVGGMTLNAAKGVGGAFHLSNTKVNPDSKVDLSSVFRNKASTVLTRKLASSGESGNYLVPPYKEDFEEPGDDSGGDAGGDQNQSNGGVDVVQFGQVGRDSL